MKFLGDGGTAAEAAVQTDAQRALASHWSGRALPPGPQGRRGRSQFLAVVIAEQDPATSTNRSATSVWTWSSDA